MGFENIPWMTHGGKHSASLGRMVAYMATGGEEGVQSLGDLRVRQAAIANGTVIVGPGGAVMVSTYAGDINESYVGRVPSDTVVNVPANGGGSTRYDLVIARIDDWNKPGGQATPGALPTDEVQVFKPQVITGVASTVKTARELNLGYPAIALARIALPAGTAAVTDAMITPLREMAQPRRKRDLRAVNQLVGRDNSLTVVATTGEQFPNDGAFTVEVPYWATQVKVKETLDSIFAPAGTAYGAIWIRFGHGRGDVVNTEASLIDFTSARADPSRVTAGNAATINIPATMRGQSVTVLLIGRKLGGTVNLKADSATAITLDMEFIEAAAEDV